MCSGAVVVLLVRAQHTTQMLLCMAQEERSPALRWWAPVSGHVLGNRSLADIDAELEELSMDARSAPERICQAHLADQLPNFERHLGPAGSSSRLPASLSAGGLAAIDVEDMAGDE